MMRGNRGHLFDKCVVEGSLLDFSAKREGGQVRNNPHGDFVWIVFIVCSLDDIGLEGHLGPMLAGNVLVFLDCVAEANLITINFEEGRGAFFAKHVTNDFFEGLILLHDGGGLVDDANLSFAGDVQ
jgi:hypothetical protein